ncbi:MAG: hypothetical protein RR346_01075 [Bacteroidales bacterium]
MSFKNSDKIALVKILSDFVKADGIVNQNEINYLQYIYEILDISPAVIKNGGKVSLSDAVRQLGQMSELEKYAVIKMMQQLSMSDDDLSQEERLLLCALLMALEIGNGKWPKARIISVADFTIGVEHHVLYLEAAYQPALNQKIKYEYAAIVALLAKYRYEFFYVPAVIEGIASRKTIFRHTLQYTEPDLSDDCLTRIDTSLDELTTSFFAREMFLNQLGLKGLDSLKPSFFLQLPNTGNSRYTDFLLLELDESDSPLRLLTCFFDMKERVAEVTPELFSEKWAKYLHRFNRSNVAGIKPGTDWQCYTGFHKIVIDTIVKHHASHKVSRLSVTKNGKIYLTDRNNMEVKMPALSKALYLFYLHHEEGVRLDELRKHREEIFHIYRAISTYTNEQQLYKAVASLTDYTGNTLSSNISRIKRAFTGILGEESAMYLISGDKGEAKRIHLDRKWIEWES